MLGIKRPNLLITYFLILFYRNIATIKSWPLFSNPRITKERKKTKGLKKIIKNIYIYISKGNLLFSNNRINRPTEQRNQH